MVPRVAARMEPTRQREALIPKLWTGILVVWLRPPVIYSARLRPVEDAEVVVETCWVV